MNNNKIDIFLSCMKDVFPQQKLSLVRDHLVNVDDERFMELQLLGYHDPVVVLIISLIVGAFGIDRFLLNHVGLGILKLLTFGGLGIWAIVDWFLIMNAAREKNYEVFSLAANGFNR